MTSSPENIVTLQESADGVNPNVVDWVTARGKCRIADTYKAILEATKKDVRSFNEMTDGQRAGRFFQCCERPDGWIVERARQHTLQGTTVLDTDPDHRQDVVLIRHDDSTIIAERGCQRRVEIVPRWNEETLSCDLFVGDTALPLWHVSQKILGEFMFGE